MNGIGSLLYLTQASMNKILVLLLLPFIPFVLFALDGRVVKITDGDTITILTSQKEQVKVRLHAIDAPEKKQAFGEASRKNLAKYCSNENAHIKETGKDRYGRTLGVVYCRGIDVNRQQVMDGYAWAFTKYSNDYINEHIEAKRAKRGLWVEEAIEPSLFRKKK